jgi:pSer/pThr/pTyr-binding forkhead associated (FHA) protein
MFSRPYRRARAAEGAGDYRRAAALYVEAELPEEAANALLFHAARASTLEERLAAYHDALRWLPEGHARIPEVEAQIGLAVLDDARRRGARSAEEKRRLADAAKRLEGAERPSEAANAWELLERWEDAARCLELAGEVERLEALLNRTGEVEDRRRKMRGLVKDYEMAMAVGARLEARDALQKALAVDPEDTSVADLLRRLSARFPIPHRIELQIDDRRVLAIGKLPAVLGRVGADVVVRGASVSRRHTEIDVVDDALVVRDLDSRNGTLIRGLPIAGAVRLEGETTLGLGDDVTLRVKKTGQLSLRIDVDRGLDRGTVVLIGRGRMPLPDAPGALTFPEGHATLTPNDQVKMLLGPQECALPILLLDEDEITLGPHRIGVRK